MCSYVKQYIFFDFYLGRRGFHDVFGHELIKWPIAKQKKKPHYQNICALRCTTTN